MTRPKLFTAQKKQLSLGKRLGKGGEGEVYLVEGVDGIAVKFYTLSDLRSREAKVIRMVATGLANSTALISYPIETVFDKKGVFAGFTMRCVSAHKPLHELYSPRSRKSEFPQANYVFLVRAATNIARAIASAHQGGCVIGDINHSGVLVSDKATASLIDADSFQITEGSTYHFCKVGTPDYTPPELQGKKLDSVARTQNHDGFGLAVIVFLLLWMGRHPFSGRYRKGDISQEKAIEQFRFVYSEKRATDMDMPPAVPKLSEFPDYIGDAFEAAFGPSGAQQRPTAKEWVGLLERLEKDLRACPQNSLHHYPQSATQCPWCRMERMQGVQLFLPPLGTIDPNAFAHFDRLKGNIEKIWKAIEGITIPANGPVQPRLQAVSPGPSTEAQAAVSSGGKGKLIGLAILAISLTALCFVPAAWFIWLWGAFYGWGKFKDKPNHSRFVNTAKDIEIRYLQSIEDWQKRIDDGKFAQLKADLIRAKQELDGLTAEELRRLQECNAKRRERHLHDFLDRFEIRRAKIRGIGPAKLAMLASYGIETAADITPNAVMRVPGFGQVTSQPLLAWRRQYEGKFHYNPSPTPADLAAERSIKMEIAKRRGELHDQLAKGPAELARLATIINQKKATVDPSLQRLHEQRAQVIADLKFLNLTMPPVTLPSRSYSGYSSAPTPTPTPPPAKTPTAQRVTCPNCGSMMIPRTAKSGRNRGGKFYGCSRFPRCRGTRPYP